MSDREEERSGNREYGDLDIVSGEQERRVVLGEVFSSFTLHLFRDKIFCKKCFRYFFSVRWEQNNS